MWSNAESVSGLLMGQNSLEDAFKIGLIYLWLQGIFYLIQTQLRFEFRPKNYAIVSVTMSVLTAVLSVWFTINLGMGLEGLLLGMAGGVTGGAMLGLWWLRDSIKFHFEIAYLREMLFFSSPLVLSSVAVWATLYVDRVMINYLLSIEDVGLYGLGYRVASISSLIMIGFQSALTPLVYANHHKSETPAQLATIFRYFFAGAIVIFLVLSLFAEQIIGIVAPALYIEAASVVALLVPAILLGNMYIFTPGMAIHKKTGIIAKLNVVGAAINLLLNFILIPKIGIQGAALATLLSYVMVFLSYLFQSQKLYYVPHQWPAIIFILVFSGSAVSFYKVLDHQGWLGVVLSLGIIFSICIALLVLRILRADELKKAIKTELPKTFPRDSSQSDK
jgi:O-antigen/teichoic acid export membrane protein